jgi:hypothetical protein
MAENTFGSLAIGLAAGAAGTAAMTLSQALEQRLRGKRREETETAASVAENVTGQEAETQSGREATSSTLHWLYGTGLGAALVPLENVSEPYRSLTFLGGVYGAGLALESIADREDAPSKRSATDFGTDFVHHLIYAGAATLAYNGLKSAFFSSGSEDDDTGGYVTDDTSSGFETGRNTGATAGTSGGTGSTGTATITPTSTTSATA